DRAPTGLGRPGGSVVWSPAPRLDRERGRAGRPRRSGPTPDRGPAMKVGLLTGGGDCPGLNAVIRAVVQRVADDGGSCLGILEGWRGLVQNMTTPLDVSITDGIIARGGTILGSSRTNPFKNADRHIPALRANFQA